MRETIKSVIFLTVASAKYVFNLCKGLKFYSFFTVGRGTAQNVSRRGGMKKKRQEVKKRNYCNNCVFVSHSRQGGRREK